MSLTSAANGCRLAAFARSLGAIAGGLALVLLLAARSAPEAAEALVLPALCPEVDAHATADAASVPPGARP